MLIKLSNIKTKKTKGDKMLSSAISVSSVSNNVNPVQKNTPIPAVDPSKGSDEAQVTFLEALEAFENALNAASANPQDPFKAQALHQAAEKLAAAETALKATGVTADTTMATNFDTDVGLAPELANLIKVASDPTKTGADVENAMNTLVDPAAWNMASEALQSFAGSL